MTRPSISVVVPVYNAEAFAGEALASVLSQTRPPDEVIVVDDGSTDATQLALQPFGDAIRIVRQENRGHPGAYNRGFAEARGDYVARCDADDVWAPEKLARQSDALTEHPEIDIAFGGAWVFGREERRFAAAPGQGILDVDDFSRTLYRGNVICASTALIRRSLWQTLGPFVDRLACEDYDFWLRALRARAVLFSDPEILVRYRQHDGNVTNSLLGMYRATHRVHCWHDDLMDDRRLVRGVLARDLSTIGRLLVEQGEPVQARETFLASLRQKMTAFALAWALLLYAPAQSRRALVGASLSIKRGLAKWLRVAPR